MSASAATNPSSGRGYQTPQSTLDRIDALYEAGLTQTEIAGVLNREGVPTARGGPWAASSVNDIGLALGRVQMRGVSRRMAQRVCRMRDRGLTHEAIAETLNSEGVPSPKGKSWHPPTVCRVERAERRRLQAQQRAQQAA